MENITNKVIEELNATLERSQNYGCAPKVFSNSDEKFENYLLNHGSILPCTHDGQPHWGFYNGRFVHASALYGDFCSHLPKKMKGQFIKGLRNGRFVFYIEYFGSKAHEYIVDTRHKI